MFDDFTMCVSHHGFEFSSTEKDLEIFFFSDLMSFRLTQRASLNSHLEESPLARSLTRGDSLRETPRKRETPHERLLARGDSLRETPHESPLKSLLASDSLRETPHERDSSPETLCKRDSSRETPCERHNNQIDHVKGGGSRRRQR